MAAGIQRLPPELMCRIADLLTMGELAVLRRACKWSENQTFNTFTRRGYAETTLRVTQRSIKLLTLVLGSDQLASRHARPNRDHSVLDNVAVEHVIASLPNLPSLKLEGLTSRGLAAQFSPQKLEVLFTSSSNITTVHFVQARLTGTEIAAVLKGLRKSIKRLDIVQVTSTDSEWDDIFLTVRSLGLEYLRVHELRGTNSGRRGRDLEYVEYGERAQKGFRGAKGWEHYVIQSKLACMMGRLAVDAGIGAMLQRLG
ncbi:hypothetical protein LTR85_010011 [Meristemomyces frigidus]|nr:hypothetical protein LTR85_010011 [Meristemomyces frigidus]